MKTLCVSNPEDTYKRVWLNDNEVTTQAWRANVPNRPGVTSVGWVDRYKEDAEGDVVFTEDGPISYRSHGLVRWAERT